MSRRQIVYLALIGHADESNGARHGAAIVERLRPRHAAPLLKSSMFTDQWQGGEDLDHKLIVDAMKEG